MCVAGLKYAPRLLDAEHTLLREDIAEARQSLAGDLRDDLLAHEADITIRIACVLGWDGVRR
jgi:hypothetical protein